MKVYLINAFQGEYSDKGFWAHSVYADIKAAEAAVNSLRATSKRLYAKKREVWSDLHSDDPFTDEEAVCAEIRKLDPKAGEWYLDPPSYSIEEKELITEVCA